MRVAGEKEGTFKITATFDLREYQGEVSASKQIQIPAPRQARETTLRRTLHQLRNGIGLCQAHTGCYPLQLSDLMRGHDDPPAYGVSVDGQTMIDIVAAVWQGPYLDTPDGELPVDPITAKADWVYDVTDPGIVHSTAEGTGADGTRYSTW